MTARFSTVSFCFFEKKKKRKEKNQVFIMKKKKKIPTAFSFFLHKDGI